MTSKEKSNFKTFLKRKVFTGEEFRYTTVKDLILFIKLYDFKVPNQYPRSLLGYSNRNNISIKGLASIIRKRYKNNFMVDDFYQNLISKKIFGTDNISSIKISF